MLPDGYVIGAMTRPEAEVLGEWAAAEQWNPGLSDIPLAYDYDPEAFIALRKGDVMVGGGSILSYGGAAGFMGLFILRADLRRQGLGAVLWHERLRRLRARLAPDAPISMDGVYDMAPFYARGGFRLLYRDVRYQGVVSATLHPDTVPLAQLPFEQIDAYDRPVFGVPRTAFLRAWLTQPGGQGVAVLRGDALKGYGFLRPCRQGYKLGPVFADDAAVADALLQSLFAQAGGQQVQLDVPEPHAAAVALADRYGLQPVFACARMVHGDPLPVAPGKIFGVTSFEFG